jgi:hypothetical protein
MEHVPPIKKNSIETGSVPEFSPEAFTRTAELNDLLAEIEQLEAGVTVEFDLPEPTDYRFFIAELGKPSRAFEFGGLYDLATRSVRLVRGYAAGERSERGAFSPAHVPFLAIGGLQMVVNFYGHGPGDWTYVGNKRGDSGYLQIQAREDRLSTRS